MRHTESTATASVALNMLHIKPRNNSSGVRARRKLWRGAPTFKCGAARSLRPWIRNVKRRIARSAIPTRRNIHNALTDGIHDAPTDYIHDALTDDIHDSGLPKP